MRKISLLLFMIFSQNQAVAQETFTDEFYYLATYQFTYQPDSTDIRSVKSEEMRLYLGKESSHFSNAGRR